MRQNLWLMCFIFALLFGSSTARAEELMLSGVMSSDRPTAIINDKIVGLGDSIGEYKVIEIGPAHVVVEGKSGRSTLSLKEETVAKPLPKGAQVLPVKDEKAALAAQAPKSNSSVSEKSRKHLNSSLEYLSMGDDLLKSPLKFDGLYAQAANLCASAEREAQAAISGFSDEAGRAEIRQHIDRIRKAKSAIAREKAELNTRFRSAIAAGKILPGMSAQNVIESWGPPLSKTDIAKIQKWVYKNSDGYQTECVFNGGILISF